MVTCCINFHFISPVKWVSCLINLWTFCHAPRICNFIDSLISWVCSFTESYISDTDNIALFKNTTLINLINPLCILLFWLIGVGIFEQYIVVSVRYIWLSKRTHPRDQRINEITYSRGVAKCLWNLLGNYLISITLPCHTSVRAVDT